MVRKKLIEVIERYLAGQMAPQDASEWALGCIKTMELDGLTPVELDAIHLLFDLHDKKETWCPCERDFEKKLRQLKDIMSQVI